MKTETVLCPLCHRSYPNGTIFCPTDGTSISGIPRTQAVGPGIKIGEYVLEKKIGEGGMGEVWSAKQPQIGKVVAIKFLSQALIANNLAVARFVQEARAVNEIQHRNIVDIFSFGELADGRPYFVMEFLKGKSLGGYLKEKGPLPFSEILPIFEQICNALQAGHELNIIHRDLKPDNLFLVSANRAGRGEAPVFVKVLDFGIAKLNAPEGESLTGAGTTMGTPAYMSPEQCHGAKSADQGSDIYSLGIILFELLTGRTPFRESGESMGLVCARQIYMPAPAPSTRVSGRSIPPELDAVVLKALAKNPKERYLHCLDFYDALAKATKPFSNETFDAIKGAAPIYSQQTEGSDPMVQLVLENLAKTAPTRSSTVTDASVSHTGDFYSSSSTDSKPETPVSAKKNNGRFVAMGVLLAASVGGVFWFSFSSGAGTTLPVTAASPIKPPEKKVTIPSEPQTQKTPASEPAINPTVEKTTIVTNKNLSKNGKKPDPTEKKTNNITAEPAPIKEKVIGEKKPEPIKEKPKKSDPASPSLIFEDKE